MKGLTVLSRKQGRLSAALAGFVLRPALAAVIYVGDGLWDLTHEPALIRVLTEFMIGLALFLGVGLGAATLRHTLETMAAQQRALAAASGAQVEVVQAQFDRWGLTAAERDVAMLALKGLDVAEIARLRGAAQGTVRAQLTRIYSKSGLSGRAQLAAHFVEDLLGGGIDTQRPAPVDHIAAARTSA